jgi:adenylate cyclase
MLALSTEIFERALRRERQWSASWLNAIRPVGVAFFFALHLVFAKSQGPGTWLLVAYTAVAAALFVLARFSEKIASWSVLAVPFLDIPAVFLKQWLDMDYSASTNPRSIATFTTGIFVLLIMLSAFALRRNWVLLAGAVAVAPQIALEIKAGDTLLGITGAVLTLIVAATLCVLATLRRVQMLQWFCREQQRVERLHRYFSPQVAKEIEAAEDHLATGHEYEITVLFSDLVGFTSAAENVPPSELVNLLNEVHSALVQAVFHHSGTLDKYTGDGLMAYFGAPIGQSDHALRALLCAQEMQNTITNLNQSRAQLGKPALRLSIGLHSGHAVVGAIGAPNRREFTAIGDTVNVASRIEKLTRLYDSPILFTERTARAVGERIALNHLGTTQVKGRSEPVELYTSTLHPAGLSKQPAPTTASPPESRVTEGSVPVRSS